MLIMPFHLALKGEALHIAHHTAEALEAINEAKVRIENFGERWWRPEVHRLRGVFLAAMGADEVQIEDAFCEAIRTAQQQKSTSSTTRAKASYTAYRAQKG